MGGGRLKTAAQLKAAKLLHWNGPRKPFKTPAGGKRAFVELFEPYASLVGKCRAVQEAKD